MLCNGARHYPFGTARPPQGLMYALSLRPSVATRAGRAGLTARCCRAHATAGDGGVPVLEIARRHVIAARVSGQPTRLRSGGWMLLQRSPADQNVVGARVHRPCERVGCERAAPTCPCQRRKGHEPAAERV